MEVNIDFIQYLNKKYFFRVYQELKNNWCISEDHLKFVNIPDAHYKWAIKERNIIQNYFFVFVPNSWGRNSGLSSISEHVSKLIDDIEFTFEGSFYRDGGVFILNDHLEVFFNKYSKNEYENMLSFKNIMEKSSSLFTEEIIEHHSQSNVWDWSILCRNNEFSWTFNLVREFSCKLNWGDLLANTQLKWSIDQLIEFKKYIVPADFRSLSLSRNVHWSIELLEHYSDNWDWGKISQNVFIPWSIELIDRFNNKLNFNLLSANKGIPWSMEIINRYNALWDWNLLSGNECIPWDLDWMLEYEERLIWNYEVNEKFGEKFNEKPSISSNKGIRWDIKMVDRFYDKIDLWKICRYAQHVNLQVLLKYKKTIDKSRLFTSRRVTKSDWGDWEDIYTNGWQNLRDNKRFIFDLNYLIEFYFLKTNIVVSDGDARDGFTYKSKICKIWDIFEFDGSHIRIDDIVLTREAVVELSNNYYKWEGLLYDGLVLNKSIWNYALREYFNSNDAINKFLTLGIKT